MNSYLQILRELPQSEKGCTAHHLVSVRQTAAHRLQHGRQQPDTEVDSLTDKSSKSCVE